MSSNVLERTRWWIAPGGVDAALHYVRTHAPADHTFDGGGFATDHGVRTLAWVSSRGSAHTDPILIVTVVPSGDGVAVRADAQIIWTPSRPESEMIPDSIDGVTVTVVREDPEEDRGAPRVRKSLGREAAQRLAAIVNSLEVEPPFGFRSCPMTVGGQRAFDQLDFTGAAPQIQVVVDLIGCGSVSFTRGRATLANLLDPNASLDRAILAELSLPADYGR